jgi:hypothetical protein
MVSQSASSTGTFDFPNTLPPARRKRSTASAFSAPSHARILSRPHVVGVSGAVKDSLDRHRQVGQRPAFRPLAIERLCACARRVHIQHW